MAVILISRELFKNINGNAEPMLELFEKMLKMPEYPIISWKEHDAETFEVQVQIHGVAEDQIVMPVYEKNSQDDDYRLVRINLHPFESGRRIIG